MSIIDTLQKQGGFKSKSTAYTNKDVEHDAILAVHSLRLKVSDRPDTEGDEIFIAEMSVVEDYNGTINVNPSGITTVANANLTTGKKAALPKRFEEMCELLSAVTGRPFAELAANPAGIRDLLADESAYAGVEVGLTSRPPKDGFYNFRWQSRADYEADRAKRLARGKAPVAAASDAEDAPKPATRAKRGAAKKAESDGLDD